MNAPLPLSVSRSRKRTKENTWWSIRRAPSTLRRLVSLVLGNYKLLWRRSYLDFTHMLKASGTKRKVMFGENANCQVLFPANGWISDSLKFLPKKYYVHSLCHLDPVVWGEFTEKEAQNRDLKELKVSVFSRYQLLKCKTLVLSLPHSGTFVPGPCTHCGCRENVAGRKHEDHFPTR